MLRRHVLCVDNILNSHCNAMEGSSFVRRYGIKLPGPLENKFPVEICPRMGNRVARLYAVKERFGVVFDAQRAILESNLGLSCREAEWFRHVTRRLCLCDRNRRGPSERVGRSIVGDNAHICVPKRRALVIDGIVRGKAAARVIGGPKPAKSPRSELAND